MSTIHVFQESDGWEIWLDTDIAEHDGLCVGTGPTRTDALTDAVNELGEAWQYCQRELDKANGVTSRSLLTRI